MDFGEFGAWWDSQQWGTVANWFSALGTVSAFGLAVLILLRDRNRAYRAMADSFVTWQTWTIERKSAGTDHTVKLFGSNTGHSPVPVASVRAKVNGKPISTNTFVNSDGGYDIAPNKQLFMFVNLGEVQQSDAALVLKFRDAQGKTWYRDLNSNKYMSKRAYDKFLEPAEGDVQPNGRFRDPAEEF